MRLAQQSVLGDKKLTAFFVSAKGNDYHSLARRPASRCQSRRASPSSRAIKWRELRTTGVTMARQAVISITCATCACIAIAT
jgi:hypothetical protein